MKYSILIPLFLVGCGGGMDRPLTDFAGVWTYSGGSFNAMCPDGSGDTEALSNQSIVFTIVGDRVKATSASQMDDSGFIYKVDGQSLLSDGVQTNCSNPQCSTQVTQEEMRFTLATPMMLTARAHGQILVCTDGGDARKTCLGEKCPYTLSGTLGR